MESPNVGKTGRLEVGQRQTLNALRYAPCCLTTNYYILSTKNENQPDPQER